MKFNHLDVPDSWERYFTKYPQGMSILEALFEWVSQVDSMVDNQNTLNNTVETYGTRLDEFLGRFDTHLRGTVETTLMDWQQTGFLDVVINAALDTKYHEMDDRLTTQLQQKAKQTDLEIERARISNLTANAGNTDGNAELLDIRVGFDGVTYATAGEATRAIGRVMTTENQPWEVN